MKNAHKHAVAHATGLEISLGKRHHQSIILNDFAKNSKKILFTDYDFFAIFNFTFPDFPLIS